MSTVILQVEEENDLLARCEIDTQKKNEIDRWFFLSLDPASGRKEGLRIEGTRPLEIDRGPFLKRETMPIIEHWVKQGKMRDDGMGGKEM